MIERDQDGKRILSWGWVDPDKRGGSRRLLLMVVLLWAFACGPAVWQTGGESAASGLVCLGFALVPLGAIVLPGLWGLSYRTEVAVGEGLVSVQRSAIGWAASVRVPSSEISGLHKDKYRSYQTEDGLVERFQMWARLRDEKQVLLISGLDEDRYQEIEAWLVQAMGSSGEPHGQYRVVSSGDTPLQGEATYVAGGSMRERVEQGRRILVMRWATPWTWGKPILQLAVLAVGLPLAVFTQVSLERAAEILADPRVHTGLLFLFVPFLGVLLWQLGPTLVNKTELVVGDGKLTVRHLPLSWGGPQWVPLARIERISLEDYTPTGPKGKRGRPYKLQVELKSGERFVLLDPVEASRGREIKQWLQQALESSSP